MPEHNAYFDKLIADELIDFEDDMPEPLDYWSLEDFAEIAPVATR